MNLDKRPINIDKQNVKHEDILLLYPNKMAYRVSEKYFSAGDGTSGTSREGTCYITEGRCTFHFKNKGSIQVESGEMFNFPSSHYKVEADYELGVKYTMVWDLNKLRAEHAKYQNT